MKMTSLSFAAALLVGSAALSGCSADGEPEVTPAQQAELDQSRDDLKKRGWIDVPPLPGTEKPDEAEEAEPADSGDDPFEGAELPAPEVPPTD